MPKNPYGGASAPPDNNTGTDGASVSADTSDDNRNNGGAAARDGGEARNSSGSSGSSGGGSSGGGSSGAASATGNAGADTSTGSARSGGAAPAGSGGASAADGAATSNGSGRTTIGARKKQYVITPLQAPDGLQTMSFQPLQFSVLEQALRNSSDIEILDTIAPKSVVGALADGMGGATHGVLVARMTDQKASQLHQQGQGRLIVEPDQHLGMMDATPRQPAMVSSVMPNSGPVLTAVISVVGKDGAPLADAEVSLFGSMLPATGTTDAGGRVQLSLLGETAATVRGLYVQPKFDYWSFYQRDPDISSDQVNVVALRALSDWPALAGFPGQRAYGWGQKSMRLDQLPGTYRGAGVKVAVIDSGVATTHRNLSTIHAGFDVIDKLTNPDGWNDDTLGHGSHCAGLIAAADIATGIRGFAPDAEIHVCKLFPGGQVSQLIDALEYCIDKQIDVVNLSLGGAEPSAALEQQILRAKRAGIACIVAAGNSGDAVQYPASSPNVLAVAAIGKLDEFPADSYHAQTLDANVDAQGYFAAKFSCYGPQIAVCAPGVAITSCVPPNNFAAWDGTSMAAPHVSGLAALALAHHPDFQAMYKTRGADRVERLFQLIKLSARRVSLGDQNRTGYGLPDVLTAVGLQQPAGQSGLSAPPLAPAAVAPQGLMSPQSLMSAQGMLAPPGLAPMLGYPAYALGDHGGQQQAPYGYDAVRAAHAAYAALAPWYPPPAMLPGLPFAGLNGPAYGRSSW